jgi:DNA-binding CsgD family transcriptional regulator
LSLTELLERESELEILTAATDATLAGEGRGIYLEGPAGIGKSELIAAAVGLAEHRGLRVLGARGHELERDFAFGVARQLFEPVVAGASAPERRRLLSGAAELARPALGLAARAPVDAGSSSLAIQHGLYWLLANLSDQAPLAIAVDDAHWADDASLRSLLYLTHRLEGVPVLVILAARAGEPAAPAELLGALAGNSRVTIVRPAVLSPAAVTEIVRRRLSPSAHDVFCAACHEASGGNPFMLAELLKAAKGNALPHDADGAAKIREISPAGISRSMLLRLARLPPGSEALARATAVLGSGAELRHAAALAGVDEESAAAAVDALTAASILRPSRRLEFVHPLVRQTIYRDIPRAERALQHVRAAQLLGKEAAPPERIAAQLLEAERRADGWAVESLRKAAAEARDRGDPASAATFVRRALEEPPDSAARSDLLVSLGDAQMALGKSAEAARTYELALESSDDPAAPMVLFPRLRTSLLLAGQLAAKGELIDRVLEDAKQDRDGLAAGSPGDLVLGLPEIDWQVTTEPEIGLAGAALYDAACGRWRHHLDALRERGQRGLDAPFATAVLAAATAYSMGPPDKAAELAEGALTGIRQVAGGDSLLPFGASNVLGALLAAERYERLDEVCREGSANSRRLGSFGMLVPTLIWAARGAYRRGALSEAEAFAREAIAAPGSSLEPLIFAGVVAALVDPLVERGALREAEQLLVDTDMADVHGTFINLGFLVHARGRLRVAQGRVAEGLDELLTLGSRYGGSDLLRGPGVWCWRSDAALALLVLGERAAAETLAAEELDLARRLGGPRALGIALRAVGLATGGKRGLAHLRRSVGALEGSPARLELARSLFELGSAVRRANQRVEAREHLRRALALARGCGAAALEARARAELELAGGRPRTPFLSGVESLTPAEWRVAELAAEGLSNPEIAQALFLTRKTIETHLGHVYQKLGIGSRDRLPEALRRRS